MEHKLTLEEKIERDLEAACKRPVKSKWCSCCGGPVDLRKKGAAAIRYGVCVAAGIKNREYHFVCSFWCFDKMWRMG